MWKWDVDLMEGLFVALLAAEHASMNALVNQASSP